GGVEGGGVGGGGEGGAKQRGRLLRREKILARRQGGPRFAILAQVGQPVRRAGGGQVRDEPEAAAVEERLQPGDDEVDVAGDVVAGQQLAAVVRQVLAQGPFAGRLGGVENAGLAQLGLAGQFGEQLLRG